MTSPLYEEVHQLALDIVNASESSDENAAQAAYEALKTLCYSHEASDLDHPLQWEALGDFSESHQASLSAYEKGLVSARALGLDDYSASILFAMAESLYEVGDVDKALTFANDANDLMVNIGDEELKSAITHFVEELTQS